MTRLEAPIVVGIDIGTTKICTLVGRAEGPHLRILGVGIEPSQGMRKGVVVDLQAAAQAVLKSIDKAEHISGYEISAPLVSLAGSEVSSVNSHGVVGVSGRVIDEDDVNRAVHAASAVAIPHNREIIHVIQRGFNVDGQEGVRTPVGMHGYRLDVEAHIITASASSVANLRQIVTQAGKEVAEFVLNPLASAEVVMTETERQMGCVVVDLGGGTTDLAIYINGDVWYSAVKAVGGNHVTNDIAQGLRLPLEQAEQIKVEHGYALASEVDPDEYFTIRPFGEEEVVQISRRELAEMIEARLEEILQMVVQEIKRSGYDGLLPAGVILTGGVAQTPGLRSMASHMLGVPVRVAKPENLLGMSDKLDNPAYATSVGLLKWALMMSQISPQEDRRRRAAFDGSRSSSGSLPPWLANLFDWLKRLAP